MKITTITLFAGVMLGLTSGAAMATNTISCQHSAQQNAYHCNNPIDGTTIQFSDLSAAQAWATANAAAIAAAQGGAGGAGGNGGQGGAGGQGGNGQGGAGGSSASNATGGNAQGGNATIINKTPKVAYSVGLGVAISAPILSGVEHDNALRTADWLYAHGYKCEAAKIVFATPQGRRSWRTADCE